MRKWKEVLAGIFIVLVTASLAACNGAEGITTTAATSAPPATTTAADTATTTSTPSPATTTTTSMTTVIPTGPEVTFVSTLQEDGRFSMLLALIDAAELAIMLEGPTPFTLFAPTDEAFDALPPGTIDDLISDTPALVEVLFHHIADGGITADQLAGMTQIEAIQGGNLEVSRQDGQLKIGEAAVLDSDIIVPNGIIHVIDAVLLLSS